MTNQMITLAVPGNLGTDAGASADGVLAGALTASAVGSFYLATVSKNSLVITDDGGLYVNETTPANEATGDDVELVGTTIAPDDAFYVGHATIQFGRIDISITTQGDYTDLVGAWQYWNGTAWTNLSDVVDGTSGWEAATGTVSVSYTLPGDWATCLVDGVLAYWIRWNCTSVTASVTPCQMGQVWVIAADGEQTFTDDTTDINDADAGDVDLMPSTLVVGDAAYFGHATEPFCKIELTISQARTGTATLQWQYWNGSAWTAITTIEDKSAGFTTGTSTYFISFVPPSDWAANTAENGPDGDTGYFVRCAATAVTSYTAQPLATRAYIYPLTTGADGIPMPETGTLVSVYMNAKTASATNADSIFLLVNTTQGTSDSVTWTQADYADTDTCSLPVTAADKVALVQIQEDGTTEFADASFVLTLSFG